MSDGNYREIAEIIAKARAKDWAGAEKRAYEFRCAVRRPGLVFPVIRRGGQPPSSSETSVGAIAAVRRR